VAGYYIVSVRKPIF